MNKHPVTAKHYTVYIQSLFLSGHERTKFGVFPFFIKYDFIPEPSFESQKAFVSSSEELLDYVPSENW